MNDLLDTFYIKNKYFKNFYNPLLYYFTQRVIKPYMLKFLVKKQFIGYIRQEREGGTPLPSYIETKGLFSIRFVETDYFQTEKIMDKNKVFFELKEQFYKRALQILSEISSECTPVFVHVRRGDYLNINYNGKIGIDLPPKYYMKAIKLLEETIVSPFYIFLSDDPSFIECCFSEINPKYISREKKEVDMAIMMNCDYGIVSNSSFSWWGAYLMKNRKMVIFPKYWFGWKTKTGKPWEKNIIPSYATVIDVE